MPSLYREFATWALHDLAIRKRQGTRILRVKHTEIRTFIQPFNGFQDGFRYGFCIF